MSSKRRTVSRNDANRAVVIASPSTFQARDVKRASSSTRRSKHTTKTGKRKSTSKTATRTTDGGSGHSTDDSMLQDKNTLTDEAARAEAQALGERLGGAQPVYLTEDGRSWYILVRRWKPCHDKAQWESQWQLHPEDFHSLVIFGKTVKESRWSQSWGVSYAYSGTVSSARPLDEKDGTMVQSLMDEVNELVSGLYPQRRPYNGCLQNWYLPEHRIGLHSDDESTMKPGLPIFSLTWGGTRRFLFRARGNRRNVRELYLHDGDLLVMGGTSQQTHKHEVPKHRTTMDPATADRINWTIRAFVEQQSEG